MGELDQIQLLRKKLNLTQAELARKASVSQSLIAKIEAGKIDPTYTKTKQILDTLNNLDKKQGLKANELMQTNLISIKGEKSLKEAIYTMRENNISQIPVFQNHLPIGVISESSILHAITTHKNPGQLIVNDVMHQSPPVVNIDTNQQAIIQLLDHFPMVLVTDKARICGLITKSDILSKVLQ